MQSDKPDSQQCIKMGDSKHEGKEILELGVLVLFVFQTFHNTPSLSL